MKYKGAPQPRPSSPAPALVSQSQALCGPHLLLLAILSATAGGRGVSLHSPGDPVPHPSPPRVPLSLWL